MSGGFELRAGGRIDAPALAALLQRPAVLHGALFLLPWTADEDALGRVEEAQDQSRTGVHIVAVDHDDGSVIGAVFIRRQGGFSAHVGIVSIGVHDEWHGRGVGSALLAAAIAHADDTLGLARLTLQVAHDNATAIRLYQRHGFEREGVLRGQVFRAGRPVDMWAMARLSPRSGRDPFTAAAG